MGARQCEPEIDRLADAASELSTSSGESRVSVHTQQLASRFAAVQATARDVAKKCEEALADHQAYWAKYKQAGDFLAAASSRYGWILFEEPSIKGDRHLTNW